MSLNDRGQIVMRHCYLLGKWQWRIKLQKLRKRVEALDSATGALEAWIYPGYSPLKSGLPKPVSFVKILYL